MIRPLEIVHVHVHKRAILCLDQKERKQYGDMDERIALARSL